MAPSFEFRVEAVCGPTVGPIGIKSKEILYNANDSFKNIIIQAKIINYNNKNSKWKINHISNWKEIKKTTKTININNLLIKIIITNSTNLFKIYKITI